jgi:hypothetical protein
MQGTLNEQYIEPKQLDTSTVAIHYTPTTPDRHDNRMVYNSPDKHDSLLSTSGSLTVTPQDKPNLRRRTSSVQFDRPIIKKWRGLRYRKWVPSMAELEQV